MLDPEIVVLHVFLSQDVQGEIFDYPEQFFKERIHTIRRPKPDDFQIKSCRINKKSNKPIIISGGGVFIQMLLMN